MPAVRKWVRLCVSVCRFEVICTDVSAMLPSVLLSRMLYSGAQSLNLPSASAHCMETTVCEYSIMAAAAQNSGQSALLLTTRPLGRISSRSTIRGSVFENEEGKIKMNASRPPTSDTSATLPLPTLQTV